MDEDQYRETYKQFNSNRCVFEKMVLLRYGNCENALKILLAEREAYGCNSPAAQQQCYRLLELMRQNARFSLQLTKADAPLPHSKELKVQVGGLFGLQQLLNNKNLTRTELLQDDSIKFGEQPQAPIHNIFATINAAIQQYLQLENFPYNEIVKSIINFNLPTRKRKSKTRK